jgi:hypothetical protein
VEIWSSCGRERERREGEACTVKDCGTNLFLPLFSNSQTQRVSKVQISHSNVTSPAGFALGNHEYVERGQTPAWHWN